MNKCILVKLMTDETSIRINDKMKDCVIVDIDDIGIMVKYMKYNSSETIYYSLHSINKITLVVED